MDIVIWFICIRIYYHPRKEVRGNVMFSHCLSVRWGGGGSTHAHWSLVLSWGRVPPVSDPRLFPRWRGGVPQSGSRTGVSPPMSPARTRTGIPHPPARTRTGYPLPAPYQDQDTGAGYGAGGTPLAFSHRRTFLSLIENKWCPCVYPEIEDFKLGNLNHKKSLGIK